MSVVNFKKWAAIAATAAFAGMASEARAGLTFSDGPGPAAGAIYQNFDSPVPLTSPALFGPASDSLTVTFADPAGSATGFTQNISAAPYVVGSSGVPFGDTTPDDGSGMGHQDTTQYLTAGNTQLTMTFSTGNHYLGLLWGSVDTYNTLSFYDSGGHLIDSISGTQVLSPANGFQGAGGSAYVNIYSTVAFASVVASSSQFAFEFDNVAYAVPEPATMAMCGTALLSVTGVVLRRRKANAAQA